MIPEERGKPIEIRAYGMEGSQSHLSGAVLQKPVNGRYSGPVSQMKLARGVAKGYRLNP